jgi:hypothetical protein
MVVEAMVVRPLHRWVEKKRMTPRSEEQDDLLDGGLSIAHQELSSRISGVFMKGLWLYQV